MKMKYLVIFDGRRSMYLYAMVNQKHAVVMEETEERRWDRGAERWG